MTALHVLTNSHVAAWRSCNKLEHLRYALGYRPRTAAEALSFGRAVHAALERWWDCWVHDAPLEGAWMALDAIVDEYERARAQAMIVGYHHRWVDTRPVSLAVEAPFTLPLFNPATGGRSRSWQLGGKLDAVVLDEQGRCFVLEHKTTSEDISPGSDYWVRLRLDAQASTYLVGARSLGYQPLGIIYDVLRKPLHRPKQGESSEAYRDRMLEAIAEDPERYYQRAEVVRTADEEREAAADLWAHAQAITRSRRTGETPRNPGACLSWGRSCEFLASCTGAEDLEMSTRFRRVPPDCNEEL